MSFIHSVSRVWIDTDVALGASRGDVDDGFAMAAIVAAHRSGRLELLGISTVHGNATAAESERCARELMRRFGLSLPIFRGAEKPGQSSAASGAIAALEADTELLCLGPLTNVGAACREDEGLSRRVSLSAVGGNLSSKGFLPPLWPYEFNFARDNASARFALCRPWRSRKLYPLDVVKQLRAGADELSELAATSEMGVYLARESERWLARARRRGRRSFTLWDLPAALDAAGSLEGRREARRLAPGLRRLLPVSCSFDCLVDFDPLSAWRSFLRLLAESEKRNLRRLGPGG